MRHRTRFSIALALVGFLLSASAGSVAWRHTFDGGAPDEGMGVQTDVAGNTWFAWMTYLAPRAWIMISRLDASEVQWTVSLPVATAGPPKSGSCRIAVAGEDTYVVCHEDSADRLAFVTRLNRAGAVDWTASLNDISWATGFESDDAAVYLTGTNSAGQVSVDRFDAAGLSWSLPIPNVAAPGRPMVSSRLTIASNNVLVTGWAQTDSVDFTNHQVVEAFIARAGTDGTLNWVRTVGSTIQLNTRGRAVAQLADGTIVIGGEQSLNNTNGITTFADNILLRFDADGNELSRANIPRAGLLQQVFPLSNGDVLTIGSEFFPGALRITRTTVDGTAQWRRVRRVAGGFTSAGALRWLDDHRLLLGGLDESGFGNNGLRNLFLLEVDANTDKARHKSFGIPRGVSRSSSQRVDMALDPQGNLYFLSGDGTPWPNVVGVKYRGLKP